MSSYSPIVWQSELDLQNLSINLSESSLTMTEDEAHIPEATPFVPDRYFRQARSTSGKLAYVIFGTTERCGVYFNWCVQCLILQYSFWPIFIRQAAKHYLSTFRLHQKPDNRGYETYFEADEAWTFFQSTGVVPLAPNNGGVAASTLEFLNRIPSSTAAHPAHRVLSPSAQPTPQVGRTQAAIPAVKFYIVHVGYSPGVYNSL